MPGLEADDGSYRGIMLSSLILSVNHIVKSWIRVRDGNMKCDFCRGIGSMSMDEHVLVKVTHAIQCRSGWAGIKHVRVSGPGLLCD